MKVAIHQPAYLPWLGYLDRIRRADTFVFLDTVQFEKNSFTNRNRLLRADEPAGEGEFWLTLPVVSKGHTTSTLRETRIDATQKWKKKHVESMRQAYRRAPFFAERFSRLEELYATEHELLAELCFDQLAFWLREFEVETNIVRARDLAACGSKSQLVLDLCRHLEADTYLSGPFGRDYLDLAAFSDAGVSIEFHEFEHPRYPQGSRDSAAFVPNLGIVDLWMNVERYDWGVGSTL
jgi:hypothetical protein